MSVKPTKRQWPAIALSALLLAGAPVSAALAQTGAQARSRSSADVSAATTLMYAITLDASGSSALRPWKPLPPDLRDKRLYIAQESDGVRKRFLLNLGFFAKRAEAEAVRRRLHRDYPSAKIITVSPAEIRDSAQTAIGAPASPVAIAPIPAGTTKPVASQEVERRAALLAAQGRGALTRGDNAAAIVAFNQLLRLPPNSQSQDAQEFVGLAHERNREIATARREYTLYLRLYPEGEGAERVRQRLAALATPTPAAPLKAPKRKAVSETLIYGGLSQYYYHGASKIETTTTTPTTVDKTTLSATDQKTLVTNLDITRRTRSEDYDNRLVFRDTYASNFLPGTDDNNRVNAAYYELKHRRYDYSVRLGRQPGYSGGVLGRFDGVLAGYAFSPRWRVSAVGGEPVEWPIDSRRRFYGVSLDIGPFAEHWGGSLYTIKQEVDGVIDRRAVGAELRYFDPRHSVYTLIDYDTEFATLNVALLQANWTVGKATVFNLLADHRKSPALQLTNAVIGESTTSIEALLQTRSYEELKEQARALTATSDLYLLGVTHPLTRLWQIGGDVRLWRISETQGTASQPPTPATGNVYMYTLQAIATGLITGRDISVLSYSVIDAPTYAGDSASLTNRVRLSDKWTLDMALRWYTQTDNMGTQLDRLTPTVRLGYQWRERVILEAEYGIEDSTTLRDTTEDAVRRSYWLLGYRWDF